MALPIFTRSQITRAKKPLGSNPVHGENLGQNTQWPVQPIGLTADPTNPANLHAQLDVPAYDHDVTGVPTSSAAPKVTSGARKITIHHIFIPVTGGAQYKRATTRNQPKPWHETIDLTTKPDAHTKGQVSSVSQRPQAQMQPQFIGWDEGTRQALYIDSIGGNPLTAQDTSIHGQYNESCADAVRSPAPKSQPVKSTAGSFLNFYNTSGGYIPDGSEVPVTNSTGGRGGRASVPRAARVRNPSAGDALDRAF